MFLNYWPNAQKLPFYVVTGEIGPSYTASRLLFEQWMPKGFPGVMSVYKGRGVEWYSAEVPSSGTFTSSRPDRTAAVWRRTRGDSFARAGLV